MAYGVPIAGDEPLRDDRSPFPGLTHLLDWGTGRKATGRRHTGLGSGGRELMADTHGRPGAAALRVLDDAVAEKHAR